MVELCRQEMPSLEEALLRSKVLEDDKSSFEALFEFEFEAFSKDDVDEMEPILGTSSIKGLEPEGGEDPGEKLLLAELVV